MYSNEQIAAALDYAVLKPTTSPHDVQKACLLAKANGFASVCVHPCYIYWAAGFRVPISTVVGFPLGCNDSFTKSEEAQLAIKAGAIEIDMVMNYAALLNGDVDYVHDDIYETRASIDWLSKEIILKVILETCYLTPDQITQACLIAADAGADYVKTSTGFGTRGASVQDILTMKKALEGTNVKIKASGGIHSYDDVANYLDLGCTRIGSSQWAELLHE
jgi:deoxyribose-phosphate aldolase